MEFAPKLRRKNNKPLEDIGAGRISVGRFRCRTTQEGDEWRMEGEYSWGWRMVRGEEVRVVEDDVWWK